MVSLEPSVTVAQLGSNLYGALHYIGIDQPFNASADDTTAIAEKISAIKKAEPSTMTCYLISNEVIETALKDGLKMVVPVQQMADENANTAKLPAAVTTVLLNAQRTISIPDFPVPQFAPGTPTKEEEAVLAEELASVKKEPLNADDIDDKHDKHDTAPLDTTPLPVPLVLPTASAAAVSSAAAAADSVDLDTVALSGSAVDVDDLELIASDESPHDTVYP